MSGLTTNTPVEEQGSFPASLYNKFSKDEKYLFLGYHGYGKVFVNCNYESVSNYFDQISETCQKCSTNCISCVNNTYCE